MPRLLKEALLLALVVVSLLAVVRPARAEHSVLRLSDQKVIPFAQMVSEVSRAHVIIIGEGHDVAWHHERQLELIRTLKREGTEIAVGLEMFQNRAQDVLDRWVDREMGDDEFVQHYYENWKLPWSLYRNIFLYMNARTVPAVGLNVPVHISRKVAREGYGSLTPEELSELPPGVTCDLDPQYMAYIKTAHKAHRAHGKRKFQYFCEAQVLWEQAMAWYLGKYRAKYPGRTVVVLTGISHAMKPGLPRQLSRMSPAPSVAVVVPQTPDVRPSALNTSYTDYVILQD